MPWTSRLVRKRPRARLQRIVIRWRREHAEDMPIVAIGVGVIGATMVALKLLKLV